MLSGSCTTCFRRACEPLESAAHDRAPQATSTGATQRTSCCAGKPLWSCSSTRATGRSRYAAVPLRQGRGRPLHAHHSSQRPPALSARGYERCLLRTGDQHPPLSLPLLSADALRAEPRGDNSGCIRLAGRLRGRRLPLWGGEREPLPSLITVCLLRRLLQGGECVAGARLSLAPPGLPLFCLLSAGPSAAPGPSAPAVRRCASFVPTPSYLRCPRALLRLPIEL